MNKNHVFGILVCMLLLISTILPVSATTISKPLSQTLLRGDILYVGGVEPNNYTKIQDAIDNATDGDTVFVFHDSSPYIENIVVDVSISLVGEEKETTVIDGANIGNVANLTADDVTIMGFTLRNGNDAGIYLTSNHNTIMENIILDNFNGIEVHYENLTTAIPITVGHNTISDNRIINNSGGIFSLSGWNNTVQGNLISQTEGGIIVGAAMNTNISWNTVSENLYFGIWVLLSYNTMMYRNNLTKNGYGLWTFHTSADKIIQNNFIGNNYSAISYQRLLSKIKGFTLKHNLPVQRNVWNGNYWNEPRSLPYMIPAAVMLIFFKVPLGLQIDWHPAQAPYDIPGLS